MIDRTGTIYEIKAGNIMAKNYMKGNLKRGAD
jgi:hypothetical protein